MLLVDDDQAEVADGGEDGRAGADADARLAAAEAAPLVVALAGGEGRVEDREAVAEAGAEAGDRLRRQADLRDEDDRPLAPLQGRLDRGQVDLGLAGAGDAVEEQLPLRAGLAVEGGDQDRDGVRLLGEQLGTGGGAAEARLAGDAADADGAGGDEAALLEPAQRLAVGADRRRQLAPRHLARAQRLEHGALLGSQTLAARERRLAGRQDCRPQLGLRAHRPPAAAGPRSRRQHQLQAARGGRAVLAGDPEPEPHQLRRRPGLQRLDRLGEALGRQLGRLGEVDHDPEQAPRPERHPDDAADVDLGHRLRAPVIEGAAESAGGGQGLDPENRHRSRLWTGEDAPAGSSRTVR